MKTNRPITDRSKIQHPIDCEKVPHDKPGGGYLHDEDDDRPYDVDGWPYCGRCHYVLDKNNDWSVRSGRRGIYEQQQTD